MEPTEIPAAQNSALNLRPLRLLSVILTLAAILVLFIGYRLSQRGQWLPDSPEMIGPWVVSEKPLSSVALQQIGRPRTKGRVYENPFEEKVDVHLISASDYQSYLDPQFAMGSYEFAVTAEKRYPLFGATGPVRALIFRNARNQQRFLMYYWIQNRDGSTNARDSLRSDRDFLPRLRLGLNATLTGNERCIVRVFTPLSPSDISGTQARRNLNEVCIGMHDFWQKGGER